MSSNEFDFGLTLDRNQSQASTHKLFAMHVCIPTPRNKNKDECNAYVNIE